MALFGKKKEEKKNAEQPTATATPIEGATAVAEKSKVIKPAVNTAQASDRDLESIIKRPHLTEKAVGLTGQNVYTFEVGQKATKFDVRDAVTAIYGVTPERVNIVKNAPRTSLSRARGRKVREKGLKKAYVYLKKGDSINMV